MKKLILTSVVVFGTLMLAFSQEPSQPNDAKSQKASAIMKTFTENGCPGISIAVLDSDGWWFHSEGLASIEDGVAMTNSHLHYLQSVAKTYMAVAILKLYEEGKLQLDDSIDQYLDAHVSQMIQRANEISIRMLLNHTSGIPEYNFNPDYAATLLQHPETVFKNVDYISYIAGKKLDFEPGSRYSYRNSNYVILSMIADKITGDHGSYIREQIFEPLGLKNTYYQISVESLKGEKLPSSYWDRYSDGILENVSYLQQQNVAHMVGDDGIVTTTKEAVQFLKGLLEGKLLKGATMKEMMTWVKRSNDKPAYGLGLAHNEIGGHISYGHSGGGLGAGCELRYFPEKELYLFVAINIGTVTESPLHANLAEIREELYRTLLE